MARRADIHSYSGAGHGRSGWLLEHNVARMARKRPRICRLCIFNLVGNCVELCHALVCRKNDISVQEILGGVEQVRFWCSCFVFV